MYACASQKTKNTVWRGLNDHAKADNQSSLSLCLSPGDAARGAAGDGERECFWPRAGDLDAERLLEREYDLQQIK